MKDPKLSLCAPATRGVWIDLLCAMHELDRLGELRGTAEQLARLARCSTVELVQALTDLQTTQAAEVQNRNGVWILASRRMRRESATRVERANLSTQKIDKSYSFPDSDNDIDWFEVFWGEYPKKKAKLEAQKAWEKCRHIDPQKIIGAVRAAKRDPEWRKDNGQFIPYPATWLNRGCWEDQVAGAAVNAAPRPQPGGWAEWLAAHYPDAKEKNYWRVPGDVQREFKERKEAA